jgi:hypothetical protein
MLDWRPAQRVEALSQHAKVVTSVEVLPAREPEQVEVTQDLPIAQAVRAEIFPARVEVRTQQPPRELERTVRKVRGPISADTTHDLPVYRPAPSDASPRASQRPLRVVAALGGFVLLLAVLLALKLRSAPVPESLSVVTPVASQPAVPAVRAPPAEPRAVAQDQREARGSVPAQDETAPAAQAVPRPKAVEPVRPAREVRDAGSMVTQVRVRSRWAPIRVAADPTAEVQCSVPRGSALSVYGERPGTHARWFAVRCDKQTVGWIHENFLARVHR